MSSFDREYNDLNKAQKEAVDYIDGPLLVVAGPGTGKTQLLGMRVANILNRTDVYPDNVLCLTFTNKASDNMKQRLDRLMGRDSNGVAVKTFHGLAADIMNRYPQYFWRGARLSIAADAVQLEIIHRVLAKLPEDHPLALKFAGQFTLTDDVASSINLAKEAGLTPNKLRAVINSNLSYISEIEPLMSELGAVRVSSKSQSQIRGIIESLPEHPLEKLATPILSLRTVIAESFEKAEKEAIELEKNTPVSRWKARWLKKIEGQYVMSKEKERNNWWLAVADAYEKYRSQMHGSGFYDYSDMLVEAIGQIEQNEDLRASLQEQFQYVLIDEFQDTNPAQLRLAHLIADHPELDNPNIMAVGDDDQSIFKFQGAELSNMLGFSRQYKTAKLIVLTENYRSSQAILDSAEKIISHARYRLVSELPGLDKSLTAKNLPKAEGTLGHLSYRSREEQLSGLAQEAGVLLSKGNSVAILARHHASLRDMSMLLHKSNIPISYEQSNDILDQPVIEQLYLILKLVTSIKRGERDDVNELLSLTLRHPMWRLDTKELWQFALDNKASYDWYKGLGTAKYKRLNVVRSWLDWMVSQSTKEPLAVIIEYVLGLRENDIMPSPLKTYFLSDKTISESYIETLSAVQMLRTLTAEFSLAHVSKTEDFVRFVELMRNNNKVITDTSPFVSGKDSIQLLTVHKAKGLEYDAVIVVDAIEKEWSPSISRRLPPANLPLRPAEDDSDDYARLMYVAATRARHTLLLGSYKQSSKGEDVLPAQFINDLPERIVEPAESVELVQILESSLLWPRLEQTDETKLLSPRLEEFTLNVSNLINFLDVTKGGPSYFKERNLLRLPQAKTPASSFGTAIHSTLEEAQLAHNHGDFSISILKDRFEANLRAEGLPESDYKRKLAQGKRVLGRFLGKRGWEFPDGGLPEYKVADIMCGSARLGGKLDLIENYGDKTVITDYKTGKPLSSLAMFSGEPGVKAWRHKLQLVFYALLADIDPAIRAKEVVDCQMVYVESEKASQRKIIYQPTKEELTRLGTLVNAVWKHIQELNLPDTSRYSKDRKGIEAFEADLINGKI